jgi:hypothetical protein
VSGRQGEINEWEGMDDVKGGENTALADDDGYKVKNYYILILRDAAQRPVVYQTCLMNRVLNKENA